MKKIEILKDGVVAAGKVRKKGDVVEVSFGEASTLKGIEQARDASDPVASPVDAPRPGTKPGKA